MKIYTRVVFDIATGQRLEASSFEYAGPVAVCKASQQQKDAATQNQGFTTQLQGMFNNEFGQSQEINGALQKQLQTLTNEGTAGQGFGAGEEAGLRADSKDQAAQQAVEQQQATGQRMAAQGVDPTSGSVGQIDAEGANAAAAGDANAQRNITLQNAALARQKVAQGLSGTQSLAGTVASQADALGSDRINNGSNSYQEVTQAYQPSNWAGNLLSAAGTIGGSILGGPIGGMIGNKISSALSGGDKEDDFGGDDANSY